MRHRKKLHKPPNLLYAAGLVTLLCSLSLLIWIQFGPSRVEMGNSPILFMFWGVAVVVLCGRNQQHQTSFVTPILLGLILRAMFIGQAPLLSDDLYRYLWEGLVANQGYNPVVQAPNSLAHLDTDLHQLVNHPQISSIYPPMALIWFRIIDILGGQIAVVQTLALIADGLTMLGIAKILKSRSISLWPLWIIIPTGVPCCRPVITSLALV